MLQGFTESLSYVSQILKPDLGEIKFSAGSTLLQYTVDPWIMRGLGMPTPHAVENLSITLQSALHIHGSTSMDPTTFRLRSTVVRIYWKKKNPHISGFGYFKPMLFKGQLYRWFVSMLSFSNLFIGGQHPPVETFGLRDIKSPKKNCSLPKLKFNILGTQSQNKDYICIQVGVMASWTSQSLKLCTNYKVFLG